MRTLRLLTTLLMVMLSVGICSCSKDFIETKPVDQLTPNTYYNPIDSLFTEYIGDHSDIKCKGVGGTSDTIYFAGLKNNHLWFNSFEKSTKKRLYEWEDTEVTDTIQQVHTGYGEYEDRMFDMVMPRYYRRTSTGHILNLLLRNVAFQTIFINGREVKRLPFAEKEDLYDWYNESIFINGTCYSKEGEPIYSIKDSYLLKNIEPVSYEEGIRFSYSSIERFNIKEKKSVWTTSLKDIDIPSNAKVSYSILDKSSNIWKYKVDVVLYDGTKQSYIFTVNIEDGKVDIAGEGIKVTGVTLNKSQVLLDLGDTFQLVDTVKPNYAENNKVVWTSSNESVASVDQNGLVTAKSYGEAMITVTTEDGGFTATANVTVKTREISDYITSKISTAIINIGGYIEGAIGCEIINNSNEDIQLTHYEVLDDNGKVLLNESYNNKILKGGSSYQENVKVKGTFNELTLKWTYIYDGREYTYTTKCKVTSL